MINYAIIVSIYANRRNKNGSQDTTGGGCVSRDFHACQGILIVHLIPAIFILELSYLDLS